MTQDGAMTNVNNKTTPVFELSWCSDPPQAQAMTALFLQQLSPDYLSHSELQEQRAIAIGEWRPDLPAIFETQLRETLALAPATADARVAVARTDGTLAGFALVSIDDTRRAARSFATLDDLVVDARFQSMGLGGQLFDWVCAELQRCGIQRLFLESGIANTRAHDFFHARGCTTVSVTMLKELDGTTAQSHDRRATP